MKNFFPNFFVNSSWMWCMSVRHCSLWFRFCSQLCHSQSHFEDQVMKSTETKSNIDWFFLSMIPFPFQASNLRWNQLKITWKPRSLSSPALAWPLVNRWQSLVQIIFIQIYQCLNAFTPQGLKEGTLFAKCLIERKKKVSFFVLGKQTTIEI